MPTSPFESDWWFMVNLPFPLTTRPSRESTSLSAGFVDFPAHLRSALSSGADRLDPLWYALPVLQLVGILASTFALAAAPSSDGGVRSADSIGPNVDRVFAGLNQPDAPGCAVGVFQAGQVLYARGCGSANRGQDDTV